MDKSFFINQEVVPGQSSVSKTPAAGDIWRIREMIGSAVYDGTSVGFYLIYGNEVLSEFIITGEPFEDKIGIEIVGDGSKKLTLTIFNFGQANKRVSVAIRAFKRME